MLKDTSELKPKKEKWTYDSEVAAIFEKNPQLMGSSMIEIAKFFFIQGELHQSNAFEALRQKFIHFTKRMDDATYIEAKKSWSKVEDC
jgi:hypothetical protein